MIPDRNFSNYFAPRRHVDIISDCGDFVFCILITDDDTYIRRTIVADRFTVDNYPPPDDMGYAKTISEYIGPNSYIVFPAEFVVEIFVVIIA